MSKLSTLLTDLRDKPDDELRAALVTTRDELFRLHLGQHTNQVTSSAQLRTKRRDIARILTILGNRARGAEKQASKQEAAPAALAAPAKKTAKKKAKS